jgi:DNA-binding MarR family transcriptional regulator
LDIGKLPEPADRKSENPDFVSVCLAPRDAAHARRFHAARREAADGIAHVKINVPPNLNNRLAWLRVSISRPCAIFKLLSEWMKMNQMSSESVEANSGFSPDIAVDVLREVVVTLIRRERPVLSAHQFGVFLTCYLHDIDHTVRGLADNLNVSKSVITRALDKLTDLGLAVRRPDPNDGRSVLVDRTPAGRAMMQDLFDIAEAYHAERLMTSSD